jgi:hypothetical protein
MSRTLHRTLVPLFIGLLLLGCSSSPDNGPTQAVKDFYRHLNNENYRGAMSLYNAEARQVLEDPNTASAEGFAEWARVETKDGKVDEIRVLQEQADEASATVEYEVVYKDGTRANHTITLTLEDGAWKLGLIG